MIKSLVAMTVSLALPLLPLVTSSVASASEPPDLPTRAEYNGMHLMSLSRAFPFLDADGCVRNFVEHGYAPVIIWPHGVRWSADVPGAIDLGDSIVSLGGSVAVTGPMRTERDRPDGLSVPVPDVCDGPFIHAGPSEEWIAFHARHSDPEEMARVARDARISRTYRSLRMSHPDLMIRRETTGGADPQTFLFKDPVAGAALLDGLLAGVPEIRSHIVTEKTDPLSLDFNARANGIARTLHDAGIDANLRLDTYQPRSTGPVATLSVGDQAESLLGLVRSGALELPDYVRVRTTYANPYKPIDYQALRKAIDAPLRAHPDFDRFVAVARPVFDGRSRPQERAEDAALWMLKMGLTADRAERQAAAGLNPAYAQEHQGGSDWWHKIARSGEHTVIATVTDTAMDGTLGDGFRGTVTLRIDEALVGTLEPGETVRLRVETGTDAEGRYHSHGEKPFGLHPELPGQLTAGDRLYLTLSDDWYDFKARIDGAQPADGGYHAATRDIHRVTPDGMVAFGNDNDSPLHTIRTLMSDLSDF